MKVRFHVPAWLEIYLEDEGNGFRLTETRIYIDTNDWDDWFMENAEVLEGGHVDRRRLWNLVRDVVRKTSMASIRRTLKEIGWA